MSEEKMGDYEIKRLVEAAIASRPDLSKTKVGTEVFDGRVILVGNVDTLVQETEALSAAKSVSGVKEVISALRVAEVEPEEAAEIDDATLRSQVEAALLDHGIAIQGEGVIVSKGEVYLRGLVRYSRQRIQAERLVTTIRGVQGVHNQLSSRREGKRRKRVRG